MACANCGAALEGAFCAACGQRGDVRRLSFRELIGRSFAEVTGYEAPLWRTLRGLALRPGAVARDYAAGQRIRFVNPIKWAIATMSLLFLASRLSGVQGGVRLTSDSSEAPAWLRSLVATLDSNLAPLFVLVLLPLLAVAMRLCHRPARRNVAEELGLVLFAYGFAALLQVIHLVALVPLGVPRGIGGLVAPAWTAWAAVAFHPPLRAWSSVVRTLVAHALWVAMILFLLGAVGGAIALVLAIGDGEASAAKADPVPSHEALTIASRALGEERRVFVHLPAGYAAEPSQRYAVLYMPDGGLDEDFPHVVATVDALVAAHEIPPLLVVGIPNTERRRDLTGPTEVASDRKVAPRVGGSAAFRAFVRDELVPEIERRYRCDGDRAVVGESLAGWWVVETFLREPGLFDRAIAISPSLWWNGHRLVDEAATLVAGFDARPRRLWLAAADETDIALHVAALADVLRQRAPASLVWLHVPHPELQHGTIFRAVEADAYRWALAK